MREAVQASSLVVGTAPPGTLMCALGKTLSATLASGNIATEIRYHGGTGILIPLVQAGELDLSFCGTDDLYDQFHGVGCSVGRPNPDVRAVGVLFANRFAFLVRNDSPVRGPKDLAGYRVPSGFVDMPNVQSNVAGLLANAGLTVADTVPVPVRDLIDNVDALIDGRTDVALFGLGQLKVMQAHSAVGGIRFLPIDSNPAALTRLRSFIRTAYVGTAEPGVELPGVIATMPVAQYGVVAVVHAAVPAQLVRSLLSALVKRRTEFSSGLPRFCNLNVRQMHQAIDVPYHPGAIAYYRDERIDCTKIPDLRQ